MPNPFDKSTVVLESTVICFKVDYIFTIALLHPIWKGRASLSDKSPTQRDTLRQILFKLAKKLLNILYVTVICPWMGCGHSCTQVWIFTCGCFVPGFIEIYRAVFKMIKMRNVIKMLKVYRLRDRQNISDNKWSEKQAHLILQAKWSKEESIDIVYTLFTFLLIIIIVCTNVIHYGIVIQKDIL